MLQLLSALVGIFILGYLIDRTVAEKFFVCLKDIPEAKTHVQTTTISCSRGKVLQIKETLYGKSQYNYCIHTAGDCTELAATADHCCGQSSCDLDIKRVYSIHCAAFVTFFRLIYHCVIPSESVCPNQGQVQSTKSQEEPEVETRNWMNVVSTMGKIEHMLTTTKTVIKESSVDALKVKTHNEIPKDLTIIFGSAALVALLLACIVATIFLLRKYQWQHEKECFLQLFMGMCTREPPDGSDEPDSVENCAQHDHRGNTMVNEIPNSFVYERNESEKDSEKEIATNSELEEAFDEKLLPTSETISEKQFYSRKRKRDEYPEVPFFINQDVLNKHTGQVSSKRIEYMTLFGLQENSSKENQITTHTGKFYFSQCHSSESSEPPVLQPLHE